MKTKRVVLRFLPVASLALLAGCATSQRQAGQPAHELAALKLYWNGRTDNFTAATQVSEDDARAKGYGFVRVEGYVFTDQSPGTVPLKQFWNAKRHDYFLTATARGEQNAEKAGYKFVRIEGYVYATRQPGTVPLKLFLSNKRRDHFTTSSLQGEQDARAAGYRFVRTEGYVIPERNPLPGPVLTNRPSPQTNSPQPPSKPLPENKPTTPETAGDVKQWIVQLSDADYAKREAAVTALSHHREIALPALREALEKTTDSDQRWWIQAAIQQCGGDE
ncbi:MAG: HEAT repeat domain-containing protein [Limisphaerales bacterium]